jgi:SAGA-associated factor 29
MDFRKLTALSLLGYVDHHGMNNKGNEMNKIHKCCFRCLCEERERKSVHQSLLVTIALISLILTHSLTIYIYTGVPIRTDAPPQELAVAVARHLEALEVDEEDCIGGFLERLSKGASSSTTTTTTTNYAYQTAYFDGRALPNSVRKRKRSKWAARPGEQVAAKVTRTDENGSWILAVVQRYYSDTDTYDVQDEDDASKLIRLPWTHVMRLSSGLEGWFTARNTDCMAIFPETTSFYRAKISKTPVWKRSKAGPIVRELIVKFEDDEDQQGRTPHRRVPSRYVIPLPVNYFYDDAEDVDLSNVVGK